MEENIYYNFLRKLIIAIFHLFVVFLSFILELIWLPFALVIYILSFPFYLIEMKMVKKILKSGCGYQPTRGNKIIEAIMSPYYAMTRTGYKIYSLQEDWLDAL